MRGGLTKVKANFLAFYFCYDCCRLLPVFTMSVNSYPNLYPTQTIPEDQQMRLLSPVHFNAHHGDTHNISSIALG